jgi:small-conductance mechanosensitive channel
MFSYDLADLPGHFSKSLPRQWIAGFMFAIGAFLAMAWLNQIIAPFLKKVPPLLENTTTMVIQAMDLAIIIPLAVISGILLLRRNVWGYLLSSVFILKTITLGLAISTMGINMTLKGVPDSLGMLVPFLMITIINLGMAVSLLKNISDQPANSAK